MRRNRSSQHGQKSIEIKIYSYRGSNGWSSFAAFLFVFLIESSNEQRSSNLFWLLKATV